MQISKKEYSLLKKLYRKKQALPESLERESLFDKGFITVAITGMENGITQFSEQFEITNAGIVAFEEYHFTHSTVKWTSIRSWIAIVISLIALVFTGANVYHTFFIS